MKKKIKITKLKVFRVKGNYYTGFEIDGNDYCYIRSNRNGYYEFAKLKTIIGVDFAGRTITSKATYCFKKEDFENPESAIKIIHFTPGALAAEEGVPFVEIY